VGAAASKEPVTVLLKRGLRRRCPNCGHGGLFESWFRLRDRCPACGVRFAREDGFFIGALFVNMAVTETILFLWLAAMFLLTLPDSPIGTIIAGVVVIAVLVPIVVYPFSKTIWAAIHLAMEPLDPSEEADAAAWRFERGDADSRPAPSPRPETDIAPRPEEG
jgi:uncharacterized protein (DUF983 family)